MFNTRVNGSLSRPAPTLDEARALWVREWRRARDSRMIAARLVTDPIARAALVRVAREANHWMLPARFLDGYLGSQTAVRS